MKKILHIINIECSRKNQRFDVTNKTKKEINELIKKHYKQGINFPKIV